MNLLIVAADADEARKYAEWLSLDSDEWAYPMCGAAFYTGRYDEVLWVGGWYLRHDRTDLLFAAASNAFDLPRGIDPNLFLEPEK